jgi:hypothetical protein
VSRAREAPRVRTWLSASTAARSRDDLDNVRLAFEASLLNGDPGAAVDLALGISTLWRNAVSYAEGRRWVDALRSSDLSMHDRVWTLILMADLGLGSGNPFLMREATAEAGELLEQVDDPGGEVILAVYRAIARLVPPEPAARALEDAANRAQSLGEPGLERLARGFRAVALRMTGLSDGLEEELQGLTEAGSSSEYDRYICLWVASLLALVERDGPRLRRLMDAQLEDLMENGLQENWLTMYWEALVLIGDGQEYLPKLRRSRQRAEAEGRSADADCVLALAYDAACHDEWERAAELMGAAGTALRHDTASFIHHALMREQLVRPRLGSEVFDEATALGRKADLSELLDVHGL